MDQHSQPEHDSKHDEVNLPIAQWKRIPSLHLIAADAPGFASVKPQVLEAKAHIEPLIEGAPDVLSQALHQSGATLRGLLEQETPSAVAADAGTGRQYTQDEKRVIFLWGTSYLLEALGDALQSHSLESETARQIKQEIRGILTDCVRALSNEEDGDENCDCDDDDCDGNEDCDCDDGNIVYCSTCKTTYQSCTLAPATCLTNYQKCMATCTPP